MRTKRQPRNFGPEVSEDTAMTLRELINTTGEGDRTLRGKLLLGKFPGAYRTNGGTGEWRIPLRSLRKYQKSNAIV